MYTIINNKNSLKGQYLYYLNFQTYANEIEIKRIYVRLDKYDPYTQTRQLVYEGGHIIIPLDQINNNDKFSIVTNWGHTILSTQKQEMQRFLRKQINGNYNPYKILHIYQKDEINTWKCKIMKTIEKLKLLK